ncbi:UDP-2,3-diacylglucosamine diphosphatase [Gilliamella sp. B2776]|uniref:UDP-2,3-diacylglucosamine diphosphatase n=1 Tax=unclassified Gilliamella TaxID=2685620 RepID=UPI002269B5BA|nr:MULTISPECIES: UDP-2,3-diacylglucosamine diphosphatase [unclassified Gilliamella]MCX8649110.1 UDP-2,3-diacylglucosamine diphosphatase [Gilliamella sp. B2779]MCX8653014.1 UDP-2,3-diacylglucosamine diphosphatase [Gilliamella sp. B2737]MCX8655274.1 UDP-2,3-diacylglucosamine diphosphatase [Gilliamella sp. B2894]MCX8690922.1 UDP-2,3-diacylglucosamine diphosphatase [Gilliamella sp. B2776]MCX8694410.1 UDP-2,3-diacylglucosamine diphosphatase [Gilliamella sp. B2881]
MNNPNRYFIADIHLTDNEPVQGYFDITAGFLSFLESLPDCCELYILGDLFDYWIGDDVNSKLHQKIALALRSLTERQIRIYFVHGNRDFLLGKKYAKLCNMTILPDINCLPTGESKILFLHGDLLCTDDPQYQKFRNIMHKKWLQKVFLMLPLFIRLKIASKLRQKSCLHNRIKSESIMDVNQQTVEKMMIKYNVSTMVHGHTHKPAIHQFLVNGQPVSRLVLGAWHDGVSYIKQDSNCDALQLYNHSFK